MKSIIGVSASGVISKCMVSRETGLTNKFYTGVRELDGVDPLHEFLSRAAAPGFGPYVRNKLAKDAFNCKWFGMKPGTWVPLLDIDKKSYYIALDANGSVLKDANGNALYKYHGTGEIVDWSKVGTEKESKFWLFTKSKKKMFVAPVWYKPVKDSLLDYALYAEKMYPTLMTGAGYDKLNKAIHSFFNKIEDGSYEGPWWKTIYDVFISGRGNHRYLLSKIMPRTFDRMLSDRGVAKEMLGYNFNDISFRTFSESVAAYADKARGGNITVVDMLGTEYADLIYGKPVRKLFDVDEKTGKVTRSTDTTAHVLSKKYFMSLNISQQIEQIKSALGENAPSINKIWTFIKIRALYGTSGVLLRLINLIGKPWLFSGLMTVGKGLTGFMPLLILNSCMFVTDLVARNRMPKLDGEWKGFLSKWNLNDGLPENMLGYSSGIGQTWGDFARRGVEKTIEAAEQGLFNVGDMLMQNSYMIRQYQQFFQAQFPGIRSVAELDRILTRMREINPGELNEMLDAAKGYSEYAIRNATTNTPVRASLTRVNPVENPLWQPTVDAIFSMWHFFSGWGYNKLLGGWTIFKQGIGNVYRGEIGSEYLDQLLKSGVDKAQIRGLMVRKYLENEDFIYMMYKFHTALMIGKYIDRLTEGGAEKDDETFFEDLGDALSYMELFSGEMAAMTANPEGRLINTFVRTMVGELENGTTMGKATEASIYALTKEAFRSFFRKLYLPQIGTELTVLMKNSWNAGEREFLPLFWKAVSDNVNGYLFYLKDSVENGEYDYYTPRGPNSYVRSILGKSNESLEFINEQKRLNTLANLEGSFDWSNRTKYLEGNTFHNWVIYSFPFLKQYNLSGIEDVEGFLDDHNKFRATQAYKDMINGELPSDMQDQDWEYIYNIVTGRLASDKENIHNDDLFTEYSFIGEDGHKAYNKARQSQENLIHLLMVNEVGEDRIKYFQNLIESKSTTKYDEEAIRTLAYMEAKTPGSSLQALAYMMNNEWYNYVYRSGIYYNDTPESQELLKKRMEEGKLLAAKKYADYVPDVDRYFTWTQFILHYAETHNTSIAKYIEWNGDNNSGTMKLVTPGSERDEDGNIRQNRRLMQNFNAQLMVDIEGSEGNPNAYMLMNGFASIFEMHKHENADGTLDPEYAAYALNQTETILDHVNGLALNSNQKRMIKQGVFMFGDKLLPYIIKDEKLMERADVQNIVSDWTHYWYKEFKELNDIATEAAEDELQNSEWKRFGAKRNYFNGGASKKFPGFAKRYDYMKNRAYSNNYMKYRVYDWTPRGGQKGYLSEWEFNEARHGLGGWTKLKKQASGRAKKDENGIGVSSRRGKALQFYKREDIDKPVEYKTPRRKRWVRKGKGVKPISVTTWKRLTPKPKTNG